jgi:hypothetical protein
MKKIKVSEFLDIVDVMDPKDKIVKYTVNHKTKEAILDMKKFLVAYGRKIESIVREQHGTK